VRAKQAGGCAAEGRTWPRVRPGNGAGKGMTGGGPHLSSAAGAGEAKRAGGGGLGRKGRAGPRLRCWLAAGLLRASC
jgi:hypothetical protein